MYSRPRVRSMPRSRSCLSKNDRPKNLYVRFEQRVTDNSAIKPYWYDPVSSTTIKTAVSGAPITDAPTADKVATVIMLP